MTVYAPKLRRVNPPEIEDYTQARDVCACFNLRKASRAMTQIYDNALRPTELRLGQFMLLLSVHLLEASTMKELAEVLGLDRTALTRTVKPLVDRKFLRVQQGKDRRTRFVSLSPAGRGKLAQSFPAWEGAQAVVEELLGSDELSMLLGNLQSAFTNITEAELQDAVATSVAEEVLESEPSVPSVGTAVAEVTEPPVGGSDEKGKVAKTLPVAEEEPTTAVAVEPPAEPAVLSPDEPVPDPVSQDAKPQKPASKTITRKKPVRKAEAELQMGFGF